MTRIGVRKPFVPAISESLSELKRPPPSLTAGPYERLRVDVGELWVARADHVMREYLFSRKTWEPEEGRLLRKLIRPGTKFLDIGANVGYFSLLAFSAAAGVQLDCVEPYPPTVELLRFNLWVNGAQGNVWPVALDVERRALMITAAENNVGDARVSTGSTDDHTFADTVVPALPGDELFAGRAFDVIKVDVQGWELEVLTGMQGVLRRSREPKIVIEYWPGALRDRDIDPLSPLARYREMGFDILVSQGDDLVRLGDHEVLLLCDGAGPEGQVNLLLTRP